VELSRGGELSGSLETHNGSVRLGLPPGTDAQVACSTSNGSIRVDGDFQNMQVERSSFDGALGTGTGKITVSTYNGSVDLDAPGRNQGF
jgi:DUF4097 and DUF4098 domain-containing protein YvlB